MKLKLHCPNCKNSFNVTHDENRWVEWFAGECWTCGYRFILKDTEFDSIQPNSPFFKLIYGYHPQGEKIERQRKKEYEKEQNKARLEEKYYKDTKIKPWDRRALKRIVLEERGF